MPVAHLMTMPLHAITEIYGEAGLRDRFVGEVAALPEADRARTLTALDLAARLHRADRRVREPYPNHLLRVAIRIIRYYGVADPDVIVAALLHDAVEDHPAELAALARDGGQAPAAPARADAGAPAGADAAAVAGALAVLAARYGARVASLIAAVTNPAFDPARDAHEQYREHVVASLGRDPWARVIKISDFTDNAVGAIHSTGPKVAAAARKYRPLIPALRELIARPDTPLSAEAKQHIYGQLELAEERLGAILEG